MAWLDDLKSRAGERFEAAGYPTTRSEAWRYVKLRKLRQTAWRDAEATTVPDGVELPPALEGAAARLVFANGALDEGASNLGAAGELPAGVTITSLAEAIAQDHPGLQQHLSRGAMALDEAPLADLNAQRFRDGAFIHLAKGAAIESPIELVFASASEGHATMSHARVLVVAEAQSQATLVERWVGAGADVLENAVTQIVLDGGAVLRHVKDVAGSEQADHVHLVQVEQGRDSGFESHVVSRGGALARTELRVRLAGQGASCKLNGVYVPRGKQVHDHYTVIDHVAPHCTSLETYKGVIADAGTGTFQGRVLIGEGAVKSETHQLNKNLLLGDKAVANTKPQLEIDNDDVSATHGSTVGALDPMQLFYLLTRGIDEATARGILTLAFVQEVLGEIPVEALQHELARAMNHRLSQEALPDEDL